MGIDDRPVTPEDEVKRVGHEITLSTDTDNRDFLEGVLLSLSEKVARRLRRQGLIGRVITLKIRDTDFHTITRRTTLSQATAFEEVIYQTARALAEENQWGKKPVRLLGVSVSGLQKSETGQVPLFNEPAQQDLRRLHQTIDQIKDRFGEKAITRGRLLIKKGGDK